MANTSDKNIFDQVENNLFVFETSMFLTFGTTVLETFAGEINRQIEQKKKLKKSLTVYDNEIHMA